MITETVAPDLTQAKRRQQLMWASGDLHAVATLIQPVADLLSQAVELQAGWAVLDVAGGSGNAAIAAARCGCDGVGIDYVPALLARGCRRVEAKSVRSTCSRATPRRSRSRTPASTLALSAYGTKRCADRASANVSSAHKVNHSERKNHVPSHNR